MKISILGLGYIGTTLFACLPSENRHVVGYDPRYSTLDELFHSDVANTEPELRAYLDDARANDWLTLATTPRQAVLASDVTLVCVGTPATPNGELNLDDLEQATQQLGTALREKAGEHLVILRSTVPPGTTRDYFEPYLRNICPNPGVRVVYQPEFLREGSAVRDFFNPPFTVFGAANYDALTLSTLRTLSADVSGTLFFLEREAAEMLKLSCNAFHALKVAFANEIGAICQACGIDSGQVMDTLVRDTRLNISPQYLKPGFTFGGPCLPKDLDALCAFAQFGELGGNAGVAIPLLSHIQASNAAHLQRAVTAVRETGKQRVGVIGVAHKRGTRDLRQSPARELMLRLRADGFTVAAYDDCLTHADLSECRDSLAELIAESEVLVLVDRRYAEIEPWLTTRGDYSQVILDLTTTDAPHAAVKRIC